HVNEIAGVTIHERSPGSWQLILSGEQPERCILLSRIVPVARGARLCVQTHTLSGAVPGLLWRSESYDSDSVRLALYYERPFGVSGDEVNVELRDIRLGECK